MRIHVESYARLHLGFYTILSDEVAYGSIGLTIDNPKVIVDVKRSKRTEIRDLTGTGAKRDAEEVAKLLGLTGEINILSGIPRHVGLGSTTQLKLSIAYALTRVYGLKRSILKLAFITGRGIVSGIGIASFRHGGFILDSGRLPIGNKIHKPRSPSDIPRAMLRMAIPKTWRFIVAIPKGIRGLNERQETPILETPASKGRIEHELHDTVLLHMLPALARGDARRFGKALTKLQLLVGEYFSSFQGGKFCCWETEEIVKSLIEGGAYGAGQSSWGPTAYGLTEGAKKARRLLDYIIKSSDKMGIESEIFIAKPRNRGFLCKIIET
ncbi:MAG TPA: hypothetical protein ENG65_01900 [Candidatus Bathyarchaeota archaeon]|nr:hypothetical protein [Candidatus Bathyarchaeota archaeon]